MARVSVSASFDGGDLRKNLATVSDRVENAVKAVVAMKGTEGIAALKQNAPWTDRTGAARSGLHTITMLGGPQHVIIYSHTMHYGFWLEVKFNGRDAVILPTMIPEGRDLMKKLDGLMGRL